MEKTRKFQIGYVACTNKPTDYARYLTKLGVPQPPHYPIGVKRVHENSLNGVFFFFFFFFQSECGRHGLSNILKLQAMFLYSIYHQRAGKTNLFHMGGGRILDVPLREFHAATNHIFYAESQMRFMNKFNTFQYGISIYRHVIPIQLQRRIH